MCRLRSVPIITFVNKVDREGRPVFELLDEIADMLALDVTPMSWPLGMGGEFAGVLDLASGRVSRPEGDSRTFQGKVDTDVTLAPALAEEIELAKIGYPEFDAEAYRNGDLTPVYFGSALKDFGVADLIARSPTTRRHRARSPPSQRLSNPKSPTSPASCSRCRRTWTPTTATGSRSCGSVRGRSNAA